MTLKHIQFNDSPVMRELARQAVKNGTIAAQDVSELVRIAAAKKGESHAPSGDLFADMVRLADGLRSKGYVRNAEVLEEKLLAYKLASSELDKTLTEAHPEGDVEIEDAEDDLGTIETLESLHERIMEAVRAKPTAKQAMVKNILKIASEILKGAQEAGSGSDSNPFDTDVGTDRTKETKGKIDTINGYVVKFQTDATNELTNATNAAVAPTLTVNDVNQLNKPLLPFYAELIDESLQEIVNFLKLYNMMFRTGEVSKQTVYNILKSNPESARNTAYLVDPAIANRNFPVTDQFQSTTDKVLDWAGTIALGPTKAVYNWMKNDSAFASAAGEIHTNLVAKYNGYFGEDRLRVANQKLKTMVQDPLTTAIDKVVAAVQGVPTLQLTDTSNAKVIDALNLVVASIEAFVQEPAVASAFQVFVKVKPGGADAAKSHVLKVAQLAKVGIAQVAAVPIDQIGDPLATVDEVQAVAATVMNAGKLLTSWIKNNEGNPQAATADSTVKTLAAVYNALNEIITKRKSLSYANLIAQLPIKGVGTFQEVKQLASQWEAAINEFVSTEKSADKLYELIKVAQPVLPGLNAPVAKNTPAGGTSKAPAGKAPAFKPNAKVNPGTGRIEGTLDDDEKKAVMNMQSLIVAIADKKGREDLKRVGKDGGPDPDGAWGPGTGGILRSIQQLMTTDKFHGKLWTGVNANAGYGGTDNAIQYANENSALLTKYLQHIGGTVPVGTGQTPAAQTLHFGRFMNADITNAHLQSLQTFYKFIVDNFVLQVYSEPSTSGELQEGVRYDEFVFTLSTLVNEAKSQFDNTKKLTAYYYQYAMNLWKQWSQLGLRPGTTNLVTPQMLASANAKPIGQKGETGAGYVIDPATGKKAPAKPGQVGEGRDVGMSQELPPPFTKSGDIDLSLDMYYGALAGIFGDRMFPLRSFRAYNAEQLAYSLYDDGRNSDVKRDFKGFLNLLSKTITRAMRFYSVSGATPNEKLEAERYNMQWRDAIAMLKQQTQNW